MRHAEALSRSRLPQLALHFGKGLSNVRVQAQPTDGLWESKLDLADLKPV